MFSMINVEIQYFRELLYLIWKINEVLNVKYIFKIHRSAVLTLTSEINSFSNVRSENFIALR